MYVEESKGRISIKFIFIHETLLHPYSTSLVILLASKLYFISIPLLWRFAVGNLLF